jgi:hypothetical protein
METNVFLDVNIDEKEPLSLVSLNLINAYWRASNYLSVGQLYLRDNPLLKVTRSLGYYTRAKFYLYPSQPDHYSIRPRHDLYFGSGTRRTCSSSRYLP